MSSSSTFHDSKKHLLVLDALRGIAAIMVLIMHTFEVFFWGNYHELFINHGYLAVDFFFMLSGYVMAHAYDDRWDKMTVGDFFKRRLIRLHPLIILGMTIGALLFYFQASPDMSKVESMPVASLLLVTLIGFTLLPVPPSMDVRGWNEMHPLNGPSWSLFFEYVANVLHVFVLRKLPNPVLSLLVFLAAIALYVTAITGESGDLIGGWSLEPKQLRIGITRLLFPYMMGMLLRRVISLGSTRNTFLISSILLIAFLSFPRLGGKDHLWMNGLYEAVIISIAFPFIIYLGAIGKVKTKVMERACTLLGDLSYPLYITHFPILLVFYAWVSNNKISLVESVPYGIATMLGTILLAFVYLKVYDLPIRKKLAKRFIDPGKG